ncbi:MAG: hypothetical protein R3F02_15525 [Thiolinea sp.]
MQTYRPLHCYSGLNRLHRLAVKRLYLGLLISLLLVSDVWAVFIFAPLQNRRSLALQVGSAGNTVNTVVFDVSGMTLAPNSVPVTGISDGPNTTPAGGVEVTLEAGLFAQTQVILTVDSSAGLSCVGGSGCGSTIIPFNTVSWTSFNNDATYPTFDIQDGVFTGGSSQTLTNYYVNGGSVTMSNVLLFEYDNATLYPSGQYQGRVTFTASMP